MGASIQKVLRSGLNRPLKTADSGEVLVHSDPREIISKSPMTAMQVIVASTRNAAEFLRMKDAGTIAANNSADFIVLDANPLDDITNTRRISSVYLRGAAVERNAARAASGR